MAASQRQYRIQWPPFTPGVIALAVFFFVLWLAWALFDPVKAFVAQQLTLTEGHVVGEWKVWTLLSYALFHRDFLEVFFTALALWLFGGQLQERWSNKKWWGVQLAAVALGGLFVFVVQLVSGSEQTTTGYHAAVFALVTAFCWLHWNRRLHFFFFPMSGKIMFLFFFGLSVLLGLFSGNWPIIAVDIAGVIVGFAAGGRTFHPRDLRTRIRNWWIRRKFKVVPKTPETKPNGVKKNGKIH